MHGSLLATAWHLARHCMEASLPLHGIMLDTAWDHACQCMEACLPLHGSTLAMEWENALPLHGSMLCHCMAASSIYRLIQGILKGKYHCTIHLLFDWSGLVCFANKNKNYQLLYS